MMLCRGRPDLGELLDVASPPRHMPHHTWLQLTMTEYNMRQKLTPSPASGTLRAKLERLSPRA